MPTITLTIDPDTLDAMLRGEAVTFTGTLKAKKPKADAPLSDRDRELHQTVVELYHDHDPAMSVARAWKAIKKMDAHAADIAEALCVALDWNKGRTYAPEFFVKDFPQWCERMQIDMMDGEIARTSYRAGLGLRG